MSVHTVQGCGIQYGNVSKGTEPCLDYHMHLGWRAALESRLHACAAVVAQSSIRVFFYSILNQQVRSYLKWAFRACYSPTVLKISSYESGAEAIEDLSRQSSSSCRKASPRSCMHAMRKLSHDGPITSYRRDNEHDVVVDDFEELLPSEPDQEGEQPRRGAK